MAEDNISVAILLSNGNIPKDIFTSSVDEYFGPQLEDFKESSLSICILSEKTGLVPCKNNAATFVKSQWLFLTKFPPNQIFEFSLVICENQSWHKVLSEDSTENRLIKTFEISSDKAIVVHLEWNKPHTVSEESLMELYSMDESLIKSHYENVETSESFKNLETITEDNNDDESLLDSLQEGHDENKINNVDTDDSLEPAEVIKNDYNSNKSEQDVDDFENSTKNSENKLFDSMEEKLGDKEDNLTEDLDETKMSLEIHKQPNLESEKEQNVENEKEKDLEDEKEENLEDDDLLNLKTKEVHNLENKKPDLESEESPNLEKEELPHLKTEEVHNLENEELPHFKAEEVHNLENEELPHFKAEEVHNSENEELPHVKTEEVHNLENEELPHFKAEEVHNSENEELPHVKTEEVHNSENEELPHLKAEEVHNLENEELPNLKAEEVHNLETEELPHLKPEELHNLENEKEQNLENEELEFENKKESNVEIKNESNFKSEEMPNLEHEDISANINSITELSESEIGTTKAGKFHERANFMSFVEEPSPLITADQEVSANESVYSSERELHEKENQNILENKICLDKNEPVERSEDVSLKDDNKNGHSTSNDNLDLVKNSETVEEIASMRNETNINNPEIHDEVESNDIEVNDERDFMVKDDIDKKDNKKDKLNNPVNYEEENVMCENVCHINEDILENSNFTKTVTPQFVSCKSAQSYSETPDVLEKIDFATAVENKQLESNQRTAVLFKANVARKSPEVSPCLKIKTKENEKLNTNTETPEVIATDKMNKVINHDEALHDNENLVLFEKNKTVICENHKESKTEINEPVSTKVYRNDESEVKRDEIKIDSEIILRKNTVPKETENLSKGCIEVQEENPQPRVSDIIERFETFTVKNEKPNKPTKEFEKESEKLNEKETEKEKENNRISGIVKLYEEINLNKENVNKIPANGKIELENKEISASDKKQKNQHLTPINIDRNIEIKVGGNETVCPVPLENKEISKESPAELRINDDYKYPDSVTPTKVEQGLSQQSQYDVLFIDDDVFYKENWYKESNNRWTTLEKSKIVNNENSLTPASEVPLKNTPKASLETLNDSEIEKIKVTIDSAEPVRKKKGLMNLCGCVGGRKRS